MKLYLNGIDVECVIGERAEERCRLQRIRIDVELEIGDKAAESDELGDTVDYAALTEKIRSRLVDGKCKMIERAARIAYEACMEDEKVFGAKVRVTKAGAIAHLESASVEYDGKDESRFF